MEKNKSTNIAQDFGSYSRRVKGCILSVFGFWRNTEYGPKDKQDCGFIFFHDPNALVNPIFKPMQRTFNNVGIKVASGLIEMSTWLTSIFAASHSGQIGLPLGRFAFNICGTINLLS